MVGEPHVMTKWIMLLGGEPHVMTRWSMLLGGVYVAWHPRGWQTSCIC